MREIFISKAHRDELIAHAREVYPKEACGLLAGRDNRVERLYRMRNIDDSAVTYRFDPAEQLKAMKEIEAAGISIVAIYHSHTGSPAYPSSTDVERAFFPGTRDENYPGAAYVIVSLAGGEPDVRAFRIKKTLIEDANVRII